MSEAPHTQHVSLSDLARAAGVSLATASRVMRDQGRVSDQVRQRVKETAERIGYRPNPLVASLMHQIREGQVKAYQGTVALISASPTRANWDQNRVGRLFLRGAEEEAKRLGFRLELILPRDEGLTQTRLLQILEARGIAGALLTEQAGRYREHTAGMLDEPLVPPGPLPIVLVGHKELRPKNSFAMSDQYANARFVGNLLLERGYRRPLLLTTHYIEAVTEKRLEAGLSFSGPEGWLAVAHSNGLLAAGLPPEQAGPLVQEARANLRRALRSHRADVVISLERHALGWLREAGHDIPGELGYLTLDWSPEQPHLSGLEQRHEVVGTLAMRQLAEQIARNEIGPQEIVSGRLVEGHWREGSTLRPHA